MDYFENFKKLLSIFVKIVVKYGYIGEINFYKNYNEKVFFFFFSNQVTSGHIHAKGGSA